MKKKGLIAGIITLAITSIVWLIRKDYKRHLLMLSEEEDPKPENTKKLIEETTEEKKNNSILSRVIDYLYTKPIDDDILLSYNKVVDRLIDSNQIEIHVCCDFINGYNTLQVLFRVPKNRNYPDFVDSINSLLNEKNQDHLSKDICERVRGPWPQAPIFTKINLSKTDDGRILMNYEPTNEFEEIPSDQKDDRKKTVDRIKKYIKDVRESNSFNKGELTIESYCGINYYLFDDGSDEEIKWFCELIERFLEKDFLSITIGSNKGAKCGITINTLAFHPGYDLGEIYEIKNGVIVGTVHTVLNKLDEETLFNGDLSEED